MQREGKALETGSIKRVSSLSGKEGGLVPAVRVLSIFEDYRSH
jgi:hypothetical protein